MKQILQVTPKFCKQFAKVGDVIHKALCDYKDEVSSGSFPGSSHSPYKISSSEVEGFMNELQKLGLDKAASAAADVVVNMASNGSPDRVNRNS